MVDHIGTIQLGEKDERTMRASQAVSQTGKCIEKKKKRKKTEKP